MDVVSYLLAKNSGGGGADLSDYFENTIGAGNNYVGGFAKMIKDIPSTTTPSGTTLVSAFRGFQGATISLIDTSNVTSMQSMFEDALITTIPLLNTSSVTNMSSMFKNCPNLTTVPLLNTSSVTNVRNTFNFCPNLTDTSLDNILQMCINSNVTATSAKNLAYMGFASTDYPADRIQALAHYQDFLNAGWTIGY